MLRFLKIITPVKCVIPLCERYIRQPKEGELHQRTQKGAAVKLNQPAWAVNIDNPKGTFCIDSNTHWPHDCLTGDMPADIFMKPLPFPVFHNFVMFLAFLFLSLWFYFLFFISFYSAA